MKTGCTRFYKLEFLLRLYLMYVDESGDPGAYSGENSRHYILAGLIVPDASWKESLDRLKQFRKYLKETYQFQYRLEVHCSELIRISKIREYRRIVKKDRIEIFKNYIQNIPSMFAEGKIINICFDKTKFEYEIDFQKAAWDRLINRFDTFLKKVGAKGIIIGDDSDETKIRNLLRKMRNYNPIHSKYKDNYYQAPITNIIEDVFHRSSQKSYFIQTVDAIAQALYRSEYPKGSLKKYRIEKLFGLLDPLLVKEASGKDPLGIVRK